ncbi:E3 ubiquitin-protein ligase RNF213-like [Bufo bufo]|uniref:E3 ubiquitin-protein ligase RNF213-like n=1 Tax=Bufo bufo TaxID=8384 RepID=UPI001ABDF558|nr:E3 ubiquitin-protein ligase RNF213-like [Bufo bufo]
MKCCNCGHEPPEEKAKFCSMCGKSMQPPAPISTAIQEDTNKNSILLSEIELEPGKELVLDEGKIPACIEPASIAEHEPPSLGYTGPPGKKKKKKNKKKKGMSGQTEFMSLPATLNESRDTDSHNDEDECKSLEVSTENNTSLSTSAKVISGNTATLAVKTVSEIKDSNLITKEIQGSMETKEHELLLCNKMEYSEDKDGNEEPNNKEPIHNVTKSTGNQVISDDRTIIEKLKENESGNKKKTNHKQTTTEAENVTTSNSVAPNDGTTSNESSSNKDKVTDQVSGQTSKHLNTGPDKKGDDVSTSLDSESKDKVINQNDGERYTIANESKSRLTDGKEISKDNSNSDHQGMDANNPNNSSNKMSVAAQEPDKQGKKANDGYKDGTNENAPKNASRKNKKNTTGQDNKNDGDRERDINEPKTNQPNKKDIDDTSNEDTKKDPESSKMKEGKNKKGGNKAQEKQKSKNSEQKSVEKPENQQNEDGIKVSSSPTNEVPNTSASAMDQDLEICFHVIISKDFGLKVNEDKVIVKGGNITGYEDWKSVVCEMHYTKELKDFGFLYEGRTHVSKNNLNRNIQYKYVVLQSNGHEEYEYIYGETADKSHIINRCLFIPSNYTIKGEWHQYDDVCLKKNKGFLKYLKNPLEHVWKSESIYKKKMKAGEIMLSSIYSILETCDEINLSGFFQQLQQFYYVAARFPVDKIVDWHSQQYDKEKVNYLMMTLLNTICDPFINTNKQQESNVRLNRLIAGLICLWIARFYGIHGSKEHLTNICCILCLDEMPREKLIDELKNAKTLFGNFPE